MSGNYKITNKYDPYTVKERIDTLIEDYLLKSEKVEENHKHWAVKTCLEIMVGFPLIASYFVKKPWEEKRVYCLIAVLVYCLSLFKKNVNSVK